MRGILLGVGRLAATTLLGIAAVGAAQKEHREHSYCNPVDLPYRFELIEPSFREAADPMVLVDKGEYWLFASKSGGYWHSADLLHWTFVKATGFNLESWAPTVWKRDGHYYLISSNNAKLYSTDDLASGQWREVGRLDAAYPDPDVMVDDDGRVYLSFGASSKEPIGVAELDPANGYKEIRKVAVPVTRDPEHEGWEVPGDANTGVKSAQFIEGSWLNRFGGKYYLQYSGPGTQYRSYADGVATSDHPLGPYTYQAYSPFSFKPTGFVTGAGHSTTFAGTDGRLWHMVTMSLSKRTGFERRLGLFPAAVQPSGELTVDTYLGDYPHFTEGTRGLTGWMLLSRGKSVQVSSSLEKHTPAMAADEDIRTWWSAATGDPGEWFQLDLGAPKRVEAVQINFADEGSTLHGRSTEVYKYRLLGSLDGKRWTTLVDHSETGRDAPHDYEVLPKSARARYVKLENVYSPNGAKFSLYDLRVFGSGGGKAPMAVKQWTAERDSADSRHATVHWDAVPGADFYIVRLGTTSQSLNLNYQVYDKTTLDVRSLTDGQPYFVTVDAVSENGIAKGTAARPVR